MHEATLKQGSFLSKMHKSMVNYNERKTYYKNTLLNLEFFIMIMPVVLNLFMHFSSQFIFQGIFEMFNLRIKRIIETEGPKH